MQHDGAERRAAHARVGNAHHVLDALLRELFRDRDIAGFRHAGRADRPGIAHHEDIVFGDVERRIVDALGHVGDGIEHHRAAFMLHQFRRRRALLDDGAARREIAAQDRHAAFFLERIVARTDHGLARHVFEMS